MDINVSSDSKYEIDVNLRNYDTGTCWKHKKKKTTETKLML